jgi:hypothetical protein
MGHIFNFRIFQLNFIIFVFLYPFQFWNQCLFIFFIHVLFLFLFLSSSLLCLSFHSHISTTLDILRNLWFNHLNIYIIKQLKIIKILILQWGFAQPQIVVDFMTSKDNFSKYPSWEKPGIDGKKLSIKFQSKNLFTTITHISKFQTLGFVGRWKRRPFACF